MSKVSVIIPTQNRMDSLLRAVNSVLDQNYDDTPIIVVDDHSGQEINLNAIDSDNQIILIRNKKALGAAASRNLGLEKATGEFVLFLDDDDVLLPNMLNKSLEEIMNEGYDLVSCRSRIVGEGISQRKLERFNNQQNGRLDVYPMETQSMEHISLYVPQIHTFLVRRSAIGEIRFEEDLTYGEDIDFWLRLVANSIKCKKLDFVGCEYHLHGGSTSQNVSYQAKRAFYLHLTEKWKDNQVIKNLCYMKLAYLGFYSRELGRLRWLASAVKNPRLFLKHFRYYL